jgi:DNA-binding CsgD family transcriptional regulator
VASVVGRDAELSAIARAIGAEGAPGAVILVGGAGIGKTTLWEATVGSARAQGARVLLARPSAGEVRLAFAGLIDLCDRVEPGVLGELPAPQRAALDAALLRAEPAREGIASGAIAVGFLAVLRALALQSRVLIAVDDLQSLDSPSEEMLAFAARRLEGAEIGFVLARRPGRAGELERALAGRGLERVAVGSLTLGAVRNLLFGRLGLGVSRQLMRRIMETTDGNPLFAFEMGRSLVERGPPLLEGAVPLPDSVQEILGIRVARLPPPVRRVLLAVALSGHLSIEQLATVVGSGGVDDAVDAGVVLLDGRRVRASHPLLAAAAVKHSRARERRELHSALARVVREDELGAMHLALATSVADREVAAQIAAAAADARARGARREALQLATHALRVTPPRAAERPERVLALAQQLDDAGELRRMTALLNDELASPPPGPMTARAWIFLSEGDQVVSIREQDAYLDRALAECAEDRNLRAWVLAKKADNMAAAAIARLAEAEAWALEALRDAKEPGVQRFALYGLAWARALNGRGVDDLCQRSAVTIDPAAHVGGSAERLAGMRLMWRGELSAARAWFRSLSDLADARGELTSYAMLRLHLCELELRAGDWEGASARLDEWAQSADYETQFRPQYHRCRALLAAGVGNAADTERWETQAIERARAAACLWDELEARRARGIAALLTQAPERAVQDLAGVWEHCHRERVLEPGAFPVAPELVEALTELGELDQAHTVTDRLRALAEEQAHPWVRTSAKRCRAILSLGAGGYDEAAGNMLRNAASELEQMEMRFDSARCLLALGRAQRRAKQWGAARETLQAAIDAFSALRSDGWAARSRSELDRVGGRRRGAADGLTPTERRIAELVAEGLANKEIATRLYVTVRTVETHLTHAYAKLGVRTRAQLANRIRQRTEE